MKKLIIFAFFFSGKGEVKKINKLSSYKFNFHHHFIFLVGETLKFIWYFCFID